MIDLFERTDLSEHQKRALWALQARVNPRLLQSTGQLHWIRTGDMINGPNASVVMGAFSHNRNPTRFSNGLFGIYYGAQKQDTAIYETVFHKQRYAKERGVRAQDFHMRSWIGKILKPCYDIRVPEYNHLHDPDDYSASQAFTRWLLGADPDAFGIVFKSVRHPGGSCIAALRPPAVSRPAQGAHLVYHWDGSRITHVVEQSDAIMTF
ncbi:MAG TPA: RES domain-containing protein [Gammaproteobacteria bacterium]|nr:RES domain-containing protein [Gammaproteobacteria bacterium]